MRRFERADRCKPQSRELVSCDDEGGCGRSPIRLRTVSKAFADTNALRTSLAVGRDRGRRSAAGRRRGCAGRTVLAAHGAGGVRRRTTGLVLPSSRRGHSPRERRDGRDPRLAVRGSRLGRGLRAADARVHGSLGRRRGHLGDRQRGERRLARLDRRRRREDLCRVRGGPQAGRANRADAAPQRGVRRERGPRHVRVGRSERPSRDEERARLRLRQLLRGGLPRHRPGLAGHSAASARSSHPRSWGSGECGDDARGRQAALLTRYHEPGCRSRGSWGASSGGTSTATWCRARSPAPGHSSIASWRRLETLRPIAAGLLAGSATRDRRPAT